VKRWAREPLSFLIANLILCHSPILGYKSKCPHSLGRIDNLLLIELRRCFLLGRVILFLEEVDLSLWTPCCLHCPSTLWLSTTFWSGWSMILIVFVMLSFGKTTRTYTKDFTWLIHNLFVLIKIKEAWEFVIYGSSVPSYPNGGGEFSMIYMLRRWLLYFIIIIRRGPYDLHHTRSGYVSPFWRGVLKASMIFASAINIKVGDGCMTRFWLDHWVNDLPYYRFILTCHG